MTTLLLSLAIVLSWGSWIPIAQAVRGAKQSTRTLYVTGGNLVFASIALVVGGSAGQLTLGWRVFWLPLVGGLVWTAGSFCAFRATESIGLARAAGTWTPLNIIVAFIFGALLFNELQGISAARYAIMGGCLVLVLVGVFLIIGSQGTNSTTPASKSGVLYAVGAGVLWGGYFVPAQWAHVSSQLGNFHWRSACSPERSSSPRATAASSSCRRAPWRSSSRPACFSASAASRCSAWSRAWAPASGSPSPSSACW